ncbi:TIGR03826 family flagellar region protein [Paenibacillus sp. YPG26]|uniref:TIGR03826 family flagellar region protein n=1 Tax=Paenibacillus sp. YPG26 TaxID=2878915 RepID=UPI00203EFCDB|nr:TIGR03826 family flagellar region protein [Paenibacillus sp. YPG26]USB32846.1 flagellar protein [Paenibacillus sp. YPG26]
MNLDNCPRCGKLYAKNFKNICSACIKAIEEEYERCFKFLRENKGSTIHQLSEATEVSIKQITKFIKEGRISVENNPNMMYPCEVCGILIRDGNMCDGCRSRLTRDLTAAAKDEAVARESGQSTSSSAYRAVDRLRKD